jgi:hypothetical protein
VLTETHITELRGNTALFAAKLSDGSLQGLAKAAQAAHDDADAGDERTELGIVAAVFQDEIARRASAKTR